MARELALNYADNLSWDFMFISGDPNLRHGTGKIGLFYWWALPGLIAGAYWWAKKKLPVFLVLLIWWLVALLPASVPETTPHALRSLNALLPLALIIAAGCSHILVTVWEFVSQLNSKIKPVAKWLFWLVLTISLLWPLITYLVDYYGDYKFRSVSAWQGGYSQLAEKILELNNINALTWIQTDDTRFYLWVMLVANQKDIQLNPKKQTQFVFSQLGPYQFSQVDWFKIARNQEPILVVMTTSDFNREIKLRQLKPSWVVINQTFPTQTSYSIAGFHWPEKAALP